MVVCSTIADIKLALSDGGEEDREIHDQATIGRGPS
jgi:hypothetical protein